MGAGAGQAGTDLMKGNGREQCVASRESQGRRERKRSGVFLASHPPQTKVMAVSSYVTGRRHVPTGSSVWLGGSASLCSAASRLLPIVKFLQKIVPQLGEMTLQINTLVWSGMEAVSLPKGMGGSEDENGPECFLTASYFKQPQPQVHWFFLSLISFMLLLSTSWLYLQDKWSRR